ncbi:uncharacterized protein LOC131854192, partial [Achroia grisella]|uniref:uncharacterized protein LOC131854192 n=1 Tax=Achroia grisella TaxID=688607 RepID=UPI0027D23296
MTVKRVSLSKSEILLNNVLSNNIQTMLLPLYTFQQLSFLPNYYIRDNFITPKGVISNIISAIGTFLFSSMNLMRMSISFINNDLNIDLIVSNFLDGGLYAIGYMLIFIVNITQSTNNVQLIVTIQKVHDSLMLNDKMSKRIALQNWI